ncbi:MAG: GTP 3',8-cyclase MoaA [Holophagales bacterium]|nr:GTP 3',8-cyclase MoaA [Holophagales bacterium]
MGAEPVDRLGRPLRDLRVSVTDRCNFRCPYCMPRAHFGHDHPFLPHSEILTFEEIDRLAGVFVELGVRKIRLTGGEPLLRRDLHKLVAALARRPVDLALTTNGSLLPVHAQRLRDAGLGRLTVSLDALDDQIFRAMNDVDFPVASVLAGIDAAHRAGFPPVKINVVVRRGLNEGEIVPIARRFALAGHAVRFIEYMDVGATNRWRLDEVVPAAEVLDRLRAELPLAPVEPAYRGEVARRFRVEGGGEIGLISSVTRPFCGDCTRARLSAEGRLYTCLFARSGTDLRPVLRGDAGDEELASVVGALWTGRADRYSEERAGDEPGAGGRIEMSYIGG